MPDHRLTVVIITHNRCEELRRTLQALESLPEDPSVIVVDNGSSDHTCDMVRNRHADVTLIEAGANLGAGGRNVGVAQAESPYVAFCDDDTWYDPGALSLAADLLDAHPTLAVITASIFVQPRGSLDPICEEMAHSPLKRPSDLPGHPLLSFLAGVSVVRKTAFEALVASRSDCGLEVRKNYWPRTSRAQVGTWHTYLKSSPITSPRCCVTHT